MFCHTVEHITLGYFVMCPCRYKVDVNSTQSAIRASSPTNRRIHSLPEMADGNEETHPLEHGAFLDAWNTLVSHFNINLIMCEEMNAMK